MVWKLNEVTRAFSDQYDEEKVRLFRFAVLTPDPEDKDNGYNHGFQRLVLESGKTVELHMGIDDSNYPQGELSISERFGNSPGHVLTNIDYEPPQDEVVTVGEVRKALEASCFHDYGFLSENQGREYWYLMALKLYETKGLVVEESAIDLLTQLRILYSERSNDLWELDPGEFRREQTRHEVDKLWKNMHQELKAILTLAENIKRKAGELCLERPAREDGD